MIRLLITALFITLLASCSSQPRYIEHDQAPNSHNNQTNSQRLIDIALRQQGTPYRYGGKSPKRGFDCSGLIQFSFAQIGKRIPRTIKQQFKSRQPVSLGSLRPGDLLFYETEGRTPGHVALYLGRGEMIHAPSSGKAVKISRLNNPYWRTRLVAAGRY